MVRTFAIFATFALFLQGVAALAQDIHRPKKSIQSFPASRPRKVDGRLDEWQEEVPLRMAQPEVKLWTAWDRENLYIACQAPGPRDGKGGLERIALFLDLRPPAERNRVYRRGVYHVQLSILPPKLDEDELREGEKTGLWLAESDDPAARRLIWKEFSWTGMPRSAVTGAAVVGEEIHLEARFPWSAFPLPEGRTFEPKADIPSLFAFDWAARMAGGRFRFWAGSGLNPFDPSGLAEVALLSDAKNFSREKYDRESLVGPAPPPAALESPQEGLRLSERSSGFSVREVASPTEYVEGSPAKIEVIAGQAAKYHVQPAIYGQFSESLGMGWPIGHGAWSQALLNPSFEPGHPRLGSSLNARYIEGRASELLARWNPNYKTPESAAAAASPWTPVGNVQGVCVERDAFNSEQCQKLTLRDGNEAAVGQVVRIPIHRQRKYAAAFYARSLSPAVVSVSIRDAEQVLAEAKVKIEGTAWQRYEAAIEMPSGLAPHINRFFFALALEQGGPVWVDYATMFPADHVEGFCPEVVENLREIKPHHIRWPGGNFASGYHWRDGIGPREKRPTRLNPAWTGLEPNEVGTDEFLRFCELAGLKVMMCANFGSGAPEEAADWVEYCNGGPDTPMGKLRVQNGHAEPYDVMDWDIGNEVWGHWQIGHCPPDEYARGLLKFQEAMRARDPRIRIAACGDSPFDESGRDWNATLYEIARNGMDVVTFHTYIAPLPPAISDPAQRLRTILSHPHYYEQTIRDMADRMRSSRIEKPQIAVTEYQLEGGQFESRRLDRAAHMLWYAQMLHVWMRTGDLVPMCHITEFSPFDIYPRLLGGPSPRFEVFKLYANHAGDQPVMAKVTCPAYEAKPQARDYVPLRNVPILDVLALLGEAEGRQYISLLMVNKELGQEIRVQAEVSDFAPAQEAELFVLRDPDPAGPERATPKLSTIATRVPVGPSFACDLPPCSVVLLRIPSAASPGKPLPD